MRHRIAGVALTLAATTALAGVGAPPAAAGAIVRIDGQYGPVSIGYDRFRALDTAIREAADPAAALLALPAGERTALLYDFNPAAITSITGMPDDEAELANDCQAYPRECAEGTAPPAPPSGEVTKPEPTPDPEPCVTHEGRVAALNVFGATLYEYKSWVWRCWNGTLVTRIQAGEDYDVRWPFWECVRRSEHVAPMPTHVIAPASLTPSPAFHVVSTGECVYRIGIKAFGKEIDATLQHTYPDISTDVTGTGHAAYTGTAF